MRPNKSIFTAFVLHSVNNRQSGTVPTPSRLWLKEGNVHDLAALREIADEPPSGINLFGDKAYSDAQLKADLKAREIIF